MVTQPNGDLAHMNSLSASHSQNKAYQVGGGGGGGLSKMQPISLLRELSGILSVKMTTTWKRNLSSRWEQICHLGTSHRGLGAFYSLNCTQKPNSKKMLSSKVKFF